MSTLRAWWRRHQPTLMSLAIVLMAIASIHRLTNESYRLLWEEGRPGAIDLKILHKLVHLWFAGTPIYGELRSANHPPASYVILWPFLGWLPVTPARWFWALTTAVALAWLVHLMIRESLAETRLERAFIALLPLSMYATSATIGNGQLIVHLLPVLLAGLFLACRKRGIWRDLLAAALTVAALVKPSVSAPFFWLLLFVPARPWPALLAFASYAGLTIFAASFQAAGPVPLLRDWMEHTSKHVTRVSIEWGYASLHSALTTLGLGAWNRSASSLALTLLGLWTYRHRHGDVWILLGVSALVARVWTYHQLYDDLLILLPMVALFRIAKRGSPATGSALVAGLLLAAAWVGALAPARLLSGPPPWDSLFKIGQVSIWAVIGVFLLDQAWRDRKTRQHAE